MPKDWAAEQETTASPSARLGCGERGGAIDRRSIAARMTQKQLVYGKKVTEVGKTSA